MESQEWRDFSVSIGGEPLDGSGFETEQSIQDERDSFQSAIVESKRDGL